MSSLSFCDALRGHRRESGLCRFSFDQNLDIKKTVFICIHTIRNTGRRVPPFRLDQWSIYDGRTHHSAFIASDTLSHQSNYTNSLSLQLFRGVDLRVVKPSLIQPLAEPEISTTHQNIHLRPLFFDPRPTSRQS